LSSSFEGVSKNAQQLPKWFYLIKRKNKGEKTKKKAGAGLPSKTLGYQPSVPYK